jgi:acyl-CoA thioesterase-2
MSDNFCNVLKFLELERIEENIFRGESRDLGTPQVYGGQVLGQALLAAQATVEEGRAPHSVHSYFLRRGDFNAPIVYEVDRSRDGRSFTARRVVAVQHGRPIFTLSASFQHEEPGLEYDAKIEMPPLPGDLPKNEEWETKQQEKIAEENKPCVKHRPTSGFALRPVGTDYRSDKDSLQWWIKTSDPVPDDHKAHTALLAYFSDFGLLASSLIPLGFRIGGMDDILFATIDHSIWYHRPFKVDDWLLYYCRSVSVSGARGFAHGSIYNQDGLLVASTAQEGLARRITKK